LDLLMVFSSQQQKEKTHRLSVGSMRWLSKAPRI